MYGLYDLITVYICLDGFNQNMWPYYIMQSLILMSLYNNVWHLYDMAIKKLAAKWVSLYSGLCLVMSLIIIPIVTLHILRISTIGPF